MKWILILAFVATVGFIARTLIKKLPDPPPPPRYEIVWFDNGWTKTFVVERYWYTGYRQEGFLAFEYEGTIVNLASGCITIKEIKNAPAK